MPVGADSARIRLITTIACTNQSGTGPCQHGKGGDNTSSLMSVDDIVRSSNTAGHRTIYTRYTQIIACQV